MPVTKNQTPKIMKITFKPDARWFDVRGTNSSQERSHSSFMNTIRPKISAIDFMISMKPKVNTE